VNVSKQAKGGMARAKSLTSEQRTEIAKKAADARYQINADIEDIPKATHNGSLKIGDLILQCAVLEDRTRIITEATVAKQLGRGLGGKSYRLRDQQAAKTGIPLPLYLAGVLDPYIPNGLRQALSNPKMYRARGGVRRGVDATLLPEICEAWLKARDHEALQESQQEIARKAEILMRALAHIGITALVDEATGYQDVRPRDELHQILEAYVNKEFLPWTKRFPDEFYKQLFRLKGWQYDPISVRRPKLVGKLTAELVYEKLPPGVLGELRAKNPVIKDGKRRYKHFQFLTGDIGNPHLERHIASVITLMRIAKTWASFKRLFDKAFPSERNQLSFVGMDEEE
jgi:hypothetical protein